MPGDSLAGMAGAADVADLLRAHDEELRTEAELGGATGRRRIGPLWLGVFGARGFVTYRDLGEVADLDALIAEVIAEFAAEPGVEGFEWKTRSHDLPADLAVHLSAAGLVAQAPETVLIGAAGLLTRRPAPPRGVLIRRAGDGGRLLEDVAKVRQLHREVFGSGVPDQDASLLETLTDHGDTDELWLAEVGEEVVSAGRLNRVAGTRFAGFWGGATHPDWRGRGIYSALTAARAASAQRMGASLVYAECTELSRPILEGAGLQAVTQTTGWWWQRSAGPTPQVEQTAGAAVRIHDGRIEPGLGSRDSAGRRFAPDESHNLE